MTAEELTAGLRSGRIVRMARAEWDELAGALEEVERHPTFLAGDLVVARCDAGLVAIEEPSSRERSIRLLGNEEEARRFVQERLDTYERMWDGCGCKVEYDR